MGGWYREAGLSDIALKWMLKSASAKDLRLKAGWEEGLKPDPLGRIHESRTGFWRLWPRARRVIPEGALIHRSVIVRMEQEHLEYGPSNMPASFEVVS